MKAGMTVLRRHIVRITMDLSLASVAKDTWERTTYVKVKLVPWPAKVP